MKKELNIKKNRAQKPYSNKEYILRILWAFSKPLFNFSPRNAFKWRSFILTIFGAEIGKNVHIYSSAKIYMPWMLKIGDNSCIGEWALIYNLGMIEIGKNVTISHKVHLCAGTHDYKNPELKLIRSNILIKDNVWLCADCFLGPGIVVGEGAIISARSVVFTNIKDWNIVRGNPAQYLKKREL